MGVRLSRPLYSHTMEYYVVVKRDKEGLGEEWCCHLLPFALTNGVTWLDLKHNLLIIASLWDLSNDRCLYVP